MAIGPYRFAGTWVFDDDATGRMVAGISGADTGFTL
jgi:hypothetical protein